MQRRVDEQLAEDEVAARARGDQHRVLRDEPEAAALGPLALVDRRGVDARPARDRAAEGVGEAVGEGDEPIAHHEVVVLAARVASDPAAEQAIGRHRIAAVVGERDDDQRGGGIQEGAQVGAPVDVRRGGEVGHLAGAAGGEPARVELVAARRLDRDDRGAREAELAGERIDRDVGRDVGRDAGRRRAGHPRYLGPPGGSAASASAAAASRGPSRSSSGGSPAK